MALKKLRPFFPPIDQVQSLNLRAALLRGLEQAKKNGVLGRDAVVRRTMLDECKGERLEEVLAAFSSAVLKKLVAERSLNGGLEYRPTISEKLALENWGYRGDRASLSTLILAHKVSLSSLLAKKNVTRQKYKDFEQLLSTKECKLVQRKEQSKIPNKADRMINDTTREEVRRALRSNWTGNDRWIDSLLLSDTNPPKGGFLGTQFDQIWTGVEDGKIADIEGQNTGLLQQLDERVRLQKSRLDKWNGFRTKMFGNKPTTSPQKGGDSKAKDAGIQFNAHLNLTIEQKDTERVAERMTSLPAEYADILKDMKADFDSIKKAKMPNFSDLLGNSSRQTSFGGFQNLNIPKSIDEPISDIGEWEDEPEEIPLVPKPTKLPTTRNTRYNQPETIPPPPRRRQLPHPRTIETKFTSGNSKPVSESIPDPDPPKREITRTGSRIARPPPQRSESDNARDRQPVSLPISKTASPEVISPIESPILDEKEPITAPPPPRLSPPPPQPLPLRQVSPTQALADEILASMSNTSPSPSKKRHTLSLAERTRLSMTRTRSYSQEDDDNDNEFDPLPPPSPATPIRGNNNLRSHSYTKSEPAVPSPSAAAATAAAAADGEEYEDLLARTQRSMAGFEAARQKAQLERRRSQRKSRMPQRREGSYFPRVDEEGGGGADASIVEELLDNGVDAAEIDMETVFMSRPKIKASPPVSPLKVEWEGEGDDVEV